MTTIASALGSCDENSRLLCSDAIMFQARQNNLRLRLLNPYDNPNPVAITKLFSPAQGLNYELTTTDINKTDLLLVTAFLSL